MRGAIVSERNPKMAKTTGPLLSFGASGTIGGVQTYSKWRGISYARQRVIPANPQTAAQTLTRDLFRNLSSMWLNAPSALQTTYNAQATGQKYTGRNKFMGLNIGLLRGQTDMLAFVGSPGNLSAFPPSALAAVRDAVLDEIDVTFTLPTVPTGWTITGSTAIAFLAVADPALDVGTIYVGTSITPFTTLAITGPDRLLNYIVSGWITYTRPDGRTAYGPSLTVAAT